MRVLLDYCVPRVRADAFTGNEVRTARQQGWDALDDGPLLDQMDGQFDVLVTVDRGLRWQQNLAGRAISVGVVHVRQNKLVHLLPLMPLVLDALVGIQPAEVRVVPRDP